jgi:hypothetical protein
MGRGSVFWGGGQAEVVVVDIDFVGGEADEGFGGVGDAFGCKGADAFAVDKDFDLAAAGAGGESVPFLQVELDGFAFAFGFEHFFLVGSEAVGEFFAVVDIVFEGESAGFGVAHGDVRGADGDLADVASVGAFVVFVVEPDIEAACFFADELEFDFDLEVLLSVEADVFDGGVV